MGDLVVVVRTSTGAEDVVELEFRFYCVGDVQKSLRSRLLGT